MRARRWTPDFHPLRESSIAPVWVNLPRLPVNLFDTAALKRIASVFGRPIRPDVGTVDLSRLTAARFCVEVDLLQPLPTRIWIQNGKRGYLQEVVYDHIPKYCRFCFMIGHLENECNVRHSSHEVVCGEAIKAIDNLNGEGQGMAILGFPPDEEIAASKLYKKGDRSLVTDDKGKKVVVDVSSETETPVGEGVGEFAEEGSGDKEGSSDGDKEGSGDGDKEGSAEEGLGVQMDVDDEGLGVQMDVDVGVDLGLIHGLPEKWDWSRGGSIEKKKMVNNQRKCESATGYVIHGRDLDDAEVMKICPETTKRQCVRRISRLNNEVQKTVSAAYPHLSVKKKNKRCVVSTQVVSPRRVTRSQVAKG